MGIKWYQQQDDSPYIYKFLGEQALDRLVKRAYALNYDLYIEVRKIAYRARDKYNEAYRIRQNDEHKLLDKLRTEDEENYTHVAQDKFTTHEWPPIYDAALEVAEAEVVMVKYTA